MVVAASAGVVGPSLAAAVGPSPTAVARAAAARPVPSLTPSATSALWKRLVARRLRPQALAPTDCHPSRQVFYAATDWMRLATKLAATQSPCADYFVSVPPLPGDRTQLRGDQAWRIRALGTNFHALAEISVSGWSAWVASTGSGWYAAGVEARGRMAAAGFDVSLGDTWVVNELSSAVRRGDGSSRQDMRDFVRGLYSPAPATRGAVFVIGSSQATVELSVYQARLQDWYEDAGFWDDMSAYVSDWSQEVYGDVRNEAVPGSAPPVRRDALNDYLQHPLALARVAPASASAAATFLAAAYGPLANAAWRYDASFGWTDVPVDQMQDYVSTQVYAMRHAGDRGGFAWKPRNPTAIAPADFAAQTDALLDRLATAIRDAGTSVDPADAGVGACGPAGLDDWCDGELPGAAFNVGWRAFTAWQPVVVAFAAAPPTVPVGTPSTPFTVALRTSTGTSLPATTPVAVTLTSSSPSGSFSASSGGPWSSSLEVVVATGASTASFSYVDPAVGSPALTASAPGWLPATQTIEVTAAPAAPVPRPPVTVTVAVSAGTGNGRIVGSGGIDCDVSDGCQATFPRTADVASPVLVTLSARPGPGSVFAGWTGGCAGQGADCAVSLVQDASTTALFAALTYPVGRHLFEGAARRELAGQGADDARSAALGCALGRSTGWGLEAVAGAAATMAVVERPGAISGLARFATAVLGARPGACTDDASSALAGLVILGVARPGGRSSELSVLRSPSPPTRPPRCRLTRAALCSRARAAAGRYAAAGARRAVVAEALAVTAHRYAGAVEAGDRPGASLQIATARVYVNEWLAAGGARAAAGAALRSALSALGLKRIHVAVATARHARRALLRPPRQLNAVLKRYAAGGLGGRAGLLRSLGGLAGRGTAKDPLALLAQRSTWPALRDEAAALSIADLGLVLRALETGHPPSPALAAVLAAEWDAVAACDSGSATAVARLLGTARGSATAESTFAGPRLELLRLAGAPLAREGAAIRCGS